MSLSERSVIDQIEVLLTQGVAQIRVANQIVRTGEDGSETVVSTEYHRATYAVGDYPALAAAVGPAKADGIAAVLGWKQTPA